LFADIFIKLKSGKWIDRCTSNQDQDDHRPLLQCRRMHFTSENASLLSYLSVIIRKGNM